MSDQPFVWQGIESAPRDGTKVILSADNTKHPSWPSWYIEKGYWEVNRWMITNNGDYEYGGYGNDYICGDSCNYPKPTHWMPLPPPPVEKGGVDGE